MGRPVEYEFAEINSKHEIVAHLGDLEDEMTLGELASLFGVTQTEILFALNLPLNALAGRLLYRSVRARMTIGTDPDAPELPPDETIAHPVDITNLLLATAQYWGEGESWTWEMPKQDLYLPLYDALVDQLTILYARRTKTDRKYVVGRADTVRVEDFEMAVTRLETAMAARASELWAGYAELFAGIGLVRSAVTMQQRHWSAELEFGAITEDSFTKKTASIDKLSAAVAELEEKAAQDFDGVVYAEERAAAESLLDMLKVDEKGTHLPLQTLIEAAFTNRRTVAPEQLNRVSKATLRACYALAQSCEVERFTREHAVDILEEAGANLTDEAKVILERDGGKVGAAVIKEWEATILALRRGLHCSSTPISPLRHIQRGIRTYRLGLSGLSALLEQGVVAQVMLGLHRGFGEYSTITKVTRGMSWLLLRSLANSAVQHREGSGQVFLASGKRLSEVLKRIDGFEGDFVALISTKPDAATLRKFWFDRGKELKDLQVRPVPRSGAGAGIRTGVSFIAFLIVLEPMVQRWQKGYASDAEANAAWYSVVAGGLNLGEHGLRSLEFVYDGAPPLWRGMDLTNFDRITKGLSGAAALIGALGNYYRWEDAGARGKSVEQFFEAGAGIANLAIGIGQVMMVRSTFASAWTVGLLRMGAVLNVAGVAIGIALFVAQMVYEHVTNVGARPALMSALDALSKLPRAAAVRDVIQEVRSIVENGATALSPLENLPTGGSGARPTCWDAVRAGFSQEAIELLFDASRIQVDVAVGDFFDKKREG